MKARELHFLLGWLIDSGFDVSQSFESGESHLNYPWKSLSRVPMTQHPSLIFPLKSLEFIEGERNTDSIIPAVESILEYCFILKGVKANVRNTASKCNPLSAAILKRDERSLRTELEIHPASLSMIKYFGQNALHFATEWTDGLSILLKSGLVTNDILNQVDNEQHYALKYAALQGNKQSTKILIEASACFKISLLN